MASIGIIAPVLAVDVILEINDASMAVPCFHAGGQGANVARAVQALGEQCQLVSFSGGESGVVLESLLADAQIGTRMVETYQSTETVLTLTTAGQAQLVRQARLPTVSRHESDDLFSIASVVVLESDVVVLSGTLAAGMAEDFFERLVQLANKYHRPSIVDVAPDLLAGVLRAAPTVVKPNAGQLTVLLGRPVGDDVQTLVAAIDEVRAMGATSVVVSRGNDEAVAAFDNKVLAVRPPMVEAQGEAGAGDSMVAGLAVGLARGYTMEETLELSTAAAAASVLRHGMATFKPDIPPRLRRWVQVEQLR